MEDVTVGVNSVEAREVRYARVFVVWCDLWIWGPKKDFILSGDVNGDGMRAVQSIKETEKMCYQTSIAYTTGQSWNCVSSKPFSPVA